MNRTYKDLITAKRRRPSTRPNRSLTEEAESDRARLLFSSPFRRLQQKAQVFSLESNSAVRSRLTHSFEVSQNGRYLAQKTLQKFRDEGRADELGLTDTANAFVSMVETACLMHDIGNPPFGHLGEQAIRDWFGSHGADCFGKALGKKTSEQIEYFRDNLLADFTEFDGNAQGFRIITRLQWSIDKFGFNLTYSQLAAFMKYLRTPSEQKLGKGRYLRKPGYFYTEKVIADEIREELGLRKEQRFPLTYLMEAADDIAYCISDIEDGLEKGLFDESFLRVKLEQVWGSLKAEFENSDDMYLATRFRDSWVGDDDVELARFFSFKTRVTADLIDMAVNNYTKNHDLIFSGEAEPLLEDKGTGARLLASLKQFSIKNIYNHELAESIELAGYRMVTGLLDYYRPLLECNLDRFERVFNKHRRDHENKSIDLQSRLRNRLPAKYRRVYEDQLNSFQGENRESNEWAARAHWVTDYISGMTDRFALESYQLLSGIRINNDAH